MFFFPVPFRILSKKEKQDFSHFSYEKCIFSFFVLTMLRKNKLFPKHPDQTRIPSFAIIIKFFLISRFLPYFTSKNHVFSGFFYAFFHVFFRFKINFFFPTFSSNVDLTGFVGFFLMLFCTIFILTLAGKWKMFILIGKCLLLIYNFNTSFATASTWVELMELMSAGHFRNHLYVGICQCVFGCFLKNRRSRKHINLVRIGRKIFT